MSPLDPFAQHFDALPPTPLAGSAFDLALLSSALPDVAVDGPGFTLLDDAGGRFAIERETGVISLSSDDVLERDHGGVFAARIRVQEPSGETYELNLRLRIDGRVPQIAENETALSLAPAPQATPAAPRGPAQEWATFAATSHSARAPLGLEDEPFGALIPAAPVRVVVAGFVPFQAALPSPAAPRANWSI